MSYKPTYVTFMKGICGYLLYHKDDPGVDSASNRNEYQEYFLGGKAAGT
jgi:hypothetical protein